MLSLICDRHEHRVATVGLDPTLGDRAGSLGEAVLRADGPVVVPDAQREPGPHPAGLRCYAASPLRTPGGHLIGALCALDSEPRTLTADQLAALATLADQAVEVLELRRQSRQLHETVAELSRSHRQLAAFAGRLGHDLKTPLTAALGFGELVQEHPAVQQDPTVSDYADRAVSACRRMMAAIDRLVGDAGVAGNPHPAPVSVPELLEVVLADLGPAAAGAVLRCADATVVGDPVLLRQLLGSLIGDALRRHGTAGGCEVAVTVVSTGAVSELRVTDNCPSVETAEAPSAGMDAAGLDVAGCQRIAAAHGATLSIGEAPGGGTTVCVRLPSAGPAPD